MKSKLFTILFTVSLLPGIDAAEKVNVFVLAGDENVLRQGSIDGIPRGPGAKPTQAAEGSKVPGPKRYPMSCPSTPSHSFSPRTNPPVAANGIITITPVRSFSLEKPWAMPWSS